MSVTASASTKYEVPHEKVKPLNGSEAICIKWRAELDGKSFLEQQSLRLMCFSDISLVTKKAKIKNKETLNLIVRIRKKGHSVCQGIKRQNFKGVSPYTIMEACWMTFGQSHTLIIK